MCLSRLDFRYNAISDFLVHYMLILSLPRLESIVRYSCVGKAGMSSIIANEAQLMVRWSSMKTYLPAYWAETWLTGISVIVEFHRLFQTIDASEMCDRDLPSCPTIVQCQPLLILWECAGPYFTSSRDLITRDHAFTRYCTMINTSSVSSSFERSWCEDMFFLCSCKRSMSIVTS